MADTSFVGEPAATLAAYLIHVQDNEDVRRRRLRRAAAAAVVAVLHVVLIVLLIKAEILPRERTIPRALPPLLWLLLPRAPNAPSLAVPHKGKELPREAPMTYITPLVKQPPPEEAINPAWALGQALACGASNFAYLTPEARSLCKRPPWHYKYDRDGYIVLDTTQQRRPQEEEKLRPGDIQAQERNTAPVCPTYIDPNAPCLSRIIHGQ